MQTAVSLQTPTSPPAQLNAEVLPDLPPLTLKWRGASRLEVRHARVAHTFAVTYRPDWSARSFQAAIDDLGQNDGLRMVVLPYLDEDKLRTLETRGLSGLDLCGNAVIVVPGTWLLRFTGQPNRFKIAQPLQNPYRGKASLVGRVLLRQPAFRTLEDLHAQIVRRGGDLSLPLASRAIKQMREDVIVGSNGPYRVYLLQPNVLLSQLERAWAREAKRSNPIWRGRVALPTADFLPKLFKNAVRSKVRAVMTGVGSANRHANLSMEDTAYLYAEAAEPLLRGLEAKPGERFANLEVRRTPDPSVFFDLETDDAGVRWASPVQTDLEMHNGDARLQDGSAKLRQRLIAESLARREDAR